MDNNGGSCSAAANTVDLQDEVGRLEQDQLLPIANVGRIMKKILPRNAKISKEAKERMQECASEFISFVTSEASEKCRRERRKTVHGDDICWAFGALGMDDYVEPLKRYLERYREQEGERANQDRPDNNTTEDQGMLNQFSDYIQRPHNGSTGL